jgi:hypothetical protein
VSNSRREFLTTSCAALLGSVAVAGEQPAPQAPPGSRPAFGTAAPVGPEVDPATFAAAEKLVQVELTGAERAQAAQNWRNSMAALYERTGRLIRVDLCRPSSPRGACPMASH